MNRQRAARRAIERAWRTAPHPDLARIYLEADPAVEPLAKARHCSALHHKTPAAWRASPISEAALNARLWGEARRHLGMAIARPRQHQADQPAVCPDGAPAAIAIPR